jgi:hypothetical protein
MILQFTLPSSGWDDRSMPSAFSVELGPSELFVRAGLESYAIVPICALLMSSNSLKRRFCFVFLSEQLVDLIYSINYVVSRCAVIQAFCSIY